MIMKNEILCTISENTRWSESDLDSAFNYVGSFDLVIAAVRVADSINVSLIDACNIISP